MTHTKKYRRRQYTGKAILFFILLFHVYSIQAQDEQTATDTVQVDTMNETPQAPPQQETETTETDGGKKEKYFLDKLQFTQSPDSFQLRKLPDSLLKKMKAEKDYWYANAAIKKGKSKDKDASYTPLGQRSWFQGLLWVVIIGGFAAFVIWYLAGSNVGLFRKKARIINNTEQDEVETEDIFAINYQKEIDKAVKQDNYRLAVRLMFLRLLKNLSEKNIIQYKQGKTNMDYLLQLHPTRYYKDFFRITRNYEYSWYGQFEVNEQAYHIIRNDFDNFDKQLR
jgi:hypothetical protein